MKASFHPRCLMLNTPGVASSGEELSPPSTVQPSRVRAIAVGASRYGGRADPAKYDPYTGKPVDVTDQVEG